MYAASAGIDIVLELGVHRHRARTTELVSDLIDLATDTELDVKTMPDPEARAGIVMVRSGDAPGVVKALATEGIVADYRHDRVRISPYFYNTPEDSSRVIDAIRRRA